jgi:hypothetical protein
MKLTTEMVSDSEQLIAEDESNTNTNANLSKTLLKPKQTARKHTAYNSIENLTFNSNRIMKMYHRPTARKSTAQTDERIDGHGAVFKQTARKSTMPQIRATARKKTFNLHEYLTDSSECFSPKVENDYAEDFEPTFVHDGNILARIKCDFDMPKNENYYSFSR